MTPDTLSQDELEKLVRENQALKNAGIDLLNRAEKAEASYSAQQEEIARLREALKPFAKAAELLNFAGAGNDPSDEIELSGERLLDALRAARAALFRSVRTPQVR